MTAAEALRRAQADLARMSRIAMVGEITASVAHELTQPLAAIVANCDASLRWQRAVPPNLDEMEQAVTRIRRDALRASAVLERIRGFLRPAEPEPAAVNLGEAVQEVLEMVGSELQLHRIELDADVPTDLPHVAGTRVELQQVVLNLFTNGIESLALLEPGKPRKLRVHASRKRAHRTDALFIVVQDSGPGFPEGAEQRLFDAFYTTKSTGLGMGLAISRSIVRRHGGELSARNTQGGPRFEFFIPLPPVAGAFGLSGAAS